MDKQQGQKTAQVSNGMQDMIKTSAATQVWVRPG
jgi:hypothetical protein